MADPDVSVVVVTYNALPWVEQCLESVRDYDTIVVDHGSTDGTLDLVRAKFPAVRVIEQENRGMGGGNNAGMRAANGRYFFLLNSDAWLVDGALEALVEYADAHPDAAVV
ncbi:MAG TPA: glycosyltransferase, partial [Gaiellaceae bacterium]|nr:glycosyltransferase [Gaiellaceae bacterium]